LREEFSKGAAKVIEGYDKPTKIRLRKHIDDLKKDPPEGDIKPMKGYSDGRLRLRIGKFRIIHNYLMKPKEDESREMEKVLYIMDVGSRGDIYK